MKNSLRWLSVLGLAFWILVLGCSSAPKSGQPGPGFSREGVTDDSSVEIIYVLGHNQHRFLAEAKLGKVMAKQLLDRKILNEGAIDSIRYVDFLEKAASFASIRQSTTGNESSFKMGSNTLPYNTVSHVNDTESHDLCRAPFSVTVRVGKDAKTMAGCRSSDDGHLSRLVRDGEFLLCSKK